MKPSIETSSMEFNQQLYKKRQRSNAIGLTLSLGAMVLGLFVLDRKSVV